MKPETLQSLSVALVFMGLFFTALGGFGAFHFGRQQENAAQRERTEMARNFADAVQLLREEQRGLVQRMATVEEKFAGPPPAPSIVTALPPLAPEPSNNPVPPIEMVQPLLPLAIAPTSIPDPLLPHPPVAMSKALLSDAAVLAAPEASSKSSATAPPATAGRPAEGPLTGEKRESLLKRLREHAHQEIVIRAAAADAPAVKLAIALKALFREAGWRVAEIEMVSGRLPAHTLLLSTGAFPPPKEFVAAYAALAGSGFLVTSDLDPNQRRERVVVSVGPQG